MINLLLNYPDDSAGSIMTTEYVGLRQSMTVAESMAHIKRTESTKRRSTPVMSLIAKTDRHGDRQGTDDLG